MDTIQQPRGTRFTTILALALLLGAGAMAGCDRQLSRASVSPRAAKAQDFWEVFYMQGAKVGYGRTTIIPADDPVKGVVQIESFDKLAFVRFGQRTEQEIKRIATETPDGRLLRFKTEVSFGPSPTIVRGHVEGDQLIIDTWTKGKKDTTQIPWSDDIRGSQAVEQSLEKQPLKPGEKRSLTMFMPVLNQVADVEMTAHDYENTPVLGTKVNLLRIEIVARFRDGKGFKSTSWTDTEGQTIKTRIAGMQQESFRTTRELAMAEPTGDATFDLGSDIVVKLDKPLVKPHATRQIRYRVELTDGDPVKVFAAGPTQSIRSLDPHTAEITVSSSRPGESNSVKTASESIAKEYTVANSTLQINDSRVRAMAQEARGKLTNPQALATALERYVHRTIAKKNFTQGFATAAEVAASREGDCTEHAVLLAALARICDIPSRVAIGLVYVEQLRGFAYHMWTEVYLDGQWTALDATLGRGGIGAAHLKLTDSSLDGASAYSSFLPVMQVAGQLKISVLAVE